jgi:steroid 5-alpha reductase family enzyme
MSWIEMYQDADPMASALVACAALAIWCWIASLLTRNYSQVDRLWSILPVLYVFHFAAHGDFVDARLGLMTTLAVLWGTRLTYNYARKGGYRRGSEDYRWPVLRDRLGNVGFQVLNATFVAPLQNLLLLGLATPAHAASQYRGHPLTVLDGVATALFLAFWLGEAVADQQQWRFHVEKQRRLEQAGANEPAFLSTGLFRYSRHPNFFCEQGMWWSFYLFAVSASGQWISWPVVAPLCLSLLFQGSTALTEKVTESKYPSYGDYRRRTSRFLPMPPRA